MTDLSKSQIFTLDGKTIEINLASAAPQAKPLANRLAQGLIVDQKYKIISLLGEGGMGAVYKAYHLNLKKEVALKTLRSSSVSQEAWERFKREARSISKLTHKNIVQVFDFGVGSDELPYYTMECLSGESLADRLAAAGPLPVNETIGLFEQVCQGLLAAHKKDIVHRDLKPANIFLALEPGQKGNNDLVKIVDFGLADLATESLENQKLTTAGTIFGSPLYMSPEQSLGLQINARSDIYSCGCALFETLTGSPPFKGETAFATMLAHQQKAVPSLNDNDEGLRFPQRLDAMVRKMLAKEEGDRFQSFDEVVAELNGVRALLPQDATAFDGYAPTIIRGPRDTNKPPARLKSFLMAVALIFALAFGLGPMLSKKTSPKAPSAVSQTKVTYNQPAKYLQTPGATWAQTRKFVFPPGKKLGNFHLREARPNSIYNIDNPSRIFHEGQTGPDKEASGQLIIPADTLLELEASSDMEQKPELFNGFGPDDLDRLRLTDGFNWGNEHLAYVKKLTGLAELKISDSFVTNKCIDDINNLGSLVSLSVRRTKLTGEDLSRIKRLPKLVSLEAASVKKMTAALKKMQGESNIKTLEINHCDLTDQDIDLVCTMPFIESLDLLQNPRITEASLLHLGRLKFLSILYIDSGKLSPKLLAALSTLPNLNTLNIDQDGATATKLAMLKKTLPHCKVHLKKTGVNIKEEVTKIDKSGFLNDLIPEK